MHLYHTATVGALSTLPSLSTQSNWTVPSNVRERPASFTRRAGSTNIYRISASLARSSLTPGQTIYYRWGKEIRHDTAVDPWVWSPVFSFVVPAAPPPPPPPPPPPGSVTPSTPNLLPALATPTVLARPLGAAVVTQGGQMFAVSNFFCNGLPDNIVAAVPVPTLTWGVSGVNIEAANTAFSVQLIDPDSSPPRTLDTLALAAGFPANTPLVQRNNYPNRPASIRVILNPRFQAGAAQQTVVGCFTEPGSTQTLEPRTLVIKVDPDNLINEGDRENDNELRF